MLNTVPHPIGGVVPQVFGGGDGPEPPQLEHVSANKADSTTLTTHANGDLRIKIVPSLLQFE